MALPENLRTAVEELISTNSLGTLTRAAEELSDRYRSQGNKSKTALVETEGHRLAYLMTRLPATYEAIHTVAEELARRSPSHSPRSLLDIGSGPGTGLWAFCSVFPTLSEAVCLERDSAFAHLGQKLAASSDNPCVSSAIWTIADMATATDFPACDLVLLSYSLGELATEEQRKVLQAAWEAARQALVVIEPGTMRGYETILQVRASITAWRGHLAAPCPHADQCPMQETQDWCHFPARVARTSWHRQAKAGTLGHEDEKFSYVIFSKAPVRPVMWRVVGPPLRRSGHVHLSLCAPAGIEQRVISKKQGEVYSWARKAEWGDGYVD